MLRNLPFVVQFTYFCTRPNKRREQQNVWFFLEQLLRNFGYKKQLLPFFLATFEQLFGESRATFGKP